jgi:hypothetical protein
VAGQSPQTLVICASQPVPNGWVIVGAVSVDSCPHYNITRPNAWVIRKLP